MKVSASLPTGVAALLFEGARRHRRLERTLVDHLDERGFQEVILPVVDYLQPYEDLLSSQSRSELYRFIDRDGELLAMRSDFTPMLARLLAPQISGLDLPLNLFYRGDVLRYQEERAGRQREFYQLGAEVLGMEGAAAEEKALAQFLDLLGIGERRRLVVVLGFAGALDRLLVERPGDMGPTDFVEAIVRRERRHAKRAGQALLEVIEDGAPSDLSTLGDEAASRLLRLVEMRDRLAPLYPDIDLRIDLAEFADQVLAPDLLEQIGTQAYYDGLVFRAFAGVAAEPVGAGGRYDRLFHRLGAEVTAAGFSFSLDRLLSPSVEESR